MPAVLQAIRWRRPDAGRSGSRKMRVMDIAPFPRQINILDLANFLRNRLSETVLLWPNQGIPLLGYTCHPNDEAARETLVGILCSWSDHSGLGQPPVPGKLGRIQGDW